jgi:hypothetical protein
MKLKDFQVIAFLDHARIAGAYHDNSPASCDAEWLFFNARSIIRAEALGDANYVLELARQRQRFIQGIKKGSR